VYIFLPNSCVCGFRTSISRKLSGTLYISSIVCSRPERRLSSKAVLRAKGDTAVIVVYEVSEDEGGV